MKTRTEYHVVITGYNQITWVRVIREITGPSTERFIAESRMPALRSDGNPFTKVTKNA